MSLFATTLLPNKRRKLRWSIFLLKIRKQNFKSGTKQSQCASLPQIKCFSTTEAQELNTIFHTACLGSAHRELHLLNQYFSQKNIKYLPCVWKHMEVPYVSLSCCIQSKWKVAKVNDAVTQLNCRLLPKSKLHLNENLNQKQQVRVWRKRLTPSLNPQVLPPDMGRAWGAMRLSGAGLFSIRPIRSLLAPASQGGRFKARALLGPATSFPISEPSDQGGRGANGWEERTEASKPQAETYKLMVKEMRGNYKQQLLRVKWNRPCPFPHTSTTSYWKSDSISREIENAD